jgi:hypothetical protein
LLKRIFILLRIYRLLRRSLTEQSRCAAALERIADTLAVLVQVEPQKGRPKLTSVYTASVGKMNELWREEHPYADSGEEATSITVAEAAEAAEDYPSA